MACLKLNDEDSFSLFLMVWVLGCLEFFSLICSRICSLGLESARSFKSKMIGGNNAPFTNKELSKEIMVGSKLRNKFNRHKTKTNWVNYTKRRNKCIYLRREAVRLHFSKLCEHGIISDSLV